MDREDIFFVASGQGNGGPISSGNFTVTGDVTIRDQYANAAVTSTQSSWENSTRAIVFIANEDGCTIKSKSSYGGTTWTGVAWVKLTKE